MACTFRSVIGLGFMVAALAACDSGGSGGGAATEGTGNTGSGGSTNGTGGGGSTDGPPANSVELAPENGWVPAEGNTVGVQGALYTFADDGGSTISPADFSMASEICVQGEGHTVEMPCDAGPADECYGYFWGAGVGFNLNQEVESAPGAGDNPPQPYNADTLGVTGFYFEISGPNVPTRLRFKAKVAGDDADYCTSITEGGQAIEFIDLKKSCWMSEAGAVDTTNIEAVQWQVYTDAAGPTPFDFCISNIHAITAP